VQVWYVITQSRGVLGHAPDGVNGVRNAVARDSRCFKVIEVEPKRPVHDVGLLSFTRVVDHVPHSILVGQSL
jgi:hypothetical protein